MPRWSSVPGCVPSGGSSVFRLDNVWFGCFDESCSFRIHLGLLSGEDDSDLILHGGGSLAEGIELDCLGDGVEVVVAKLREIRN